MKTRKHGRRLSRGSGRSRKAGAPARGSRGRGSCGRGSRGGHVTKLEKRSIDSWKPLLCHSRDCVPNTCAFLGFADRQIMQQEAGLHPTGVDLEAGLIPYLNAAFPEDEHKVYGPLLWLQDGKFKYNRMLFVDVLRETDEATVGVMLRPHASGHAVAVARGPGGTMILYDPQSCNGRGGVAAVMKYMQDKGFTSLYLVSQFGPGAPRLSSEVPVDEGPAALNVPMDVVDDF